MAPEDDGAGGGAAPRTFTQAEVDAIVQERVSRAKSSASAPAKDAGARYSLAEIAELSKLFGTAAPAVPVKPAAAPNAPGRVDPITAGGLVDIWNLRDDEIAQLGPAGMREQFEKLIRHGEQASGRPAKPTIPSASSKR
ncbi:MAG: hypothetical protein NT062_36040 [Proteobacteria bacterium]|nr:hypothetical protein [Pseudomonadota bacterium]